METKDIKENMVHTTDIKAPQQSKVVKKSKKKTKKIGPKQPWKITHEAIQKLENAFAYDMTDEEACHYANISTSSLYAYQEKNPQFLERKKALKQRPVMKAREELIKKLSSRKVKTLDKEGNVVELVIPPDSNDLKWYLERKRKDEFSGKVIVEHEGDIEIKGAKEMAKVLQDILDEKDDDPKEDKGSTEDSS